MKLCGKSFKEKQIKYLTTSNWLKECNPIKSDFLNSILEYPYIEIDEGQINLLKKFCSYKWDRFAVLYTFYDAKREYDKLYKMHYKNYIDTIFTAFISGHTPAELESCVLNSDSHINNLDVTDLRHTINALDEFRELNKICTKNALKNYDLSNI